MTTTSIHPNYEQLLQESQDYWWDVRGAPEPPPPSYRMVDGEMKLGRYVDPYGVEGLMQQAKDRWHHWYVRFLIACGIGALFVGVDWVFLFLALPVLATWYLIQRNRHRKLYDEYYAVAQAIRDSDDNPVWVPFNKDRLNYIERRPQGVWP